MTTTITVRDGVQVERSDDGCARLVLEPYKGGAIGKIAVQLSEHETRALAQALEPPATIVLTDEQAVTVAVRGTVALIGEPEAEAVARQRYETMPAEMRGNVVDGARAMIAGLQALGYRIVPPAGDERPRRTHGELFTDWGPRDPRLAGVGGEQAVAARIRAMAAALHCGSLACTTLDPGRCFCTCSKCVLARGDEGLS